VQIPVGAWTSAAVLDAFPESGQTPDALIALGLVALPAAVATGWNDWSDLHQQQQRVGLVHAGSNVVAGLFYASSLVARRRGNRGLGRILGWTGYAAAGLGGFLGGHLAYRQSAGTNHAEFVPHLIKPGWHDVGSFDDLPDGKPVTRRLHDVNLMVIRTGKHADVLANRCSHLDGPLAEGQLHTQAGEKCISCPWHGSTFRIRDGAVVHGPATAPQPVFRTQVVAGRLKVLLEGAG
jgi:nitrite reductase/ring-hydroxylating ferredoxin subunit